MTTSGNGLLFLVPGEPIRMEYPGLWHRRCLDWAGWRLLQSNNDVLCVLRDVWNEKILYSIPRD
jgi:hypothetical protein